MNCQYCKAPLIESQTCQDFYDQLAFYTLAHTDHHFFLHQLIVDTYAAQHANEHSKPIMVAFALIGLYLFAEKNYSGRQIQLAHMQLAETKREYPAFVLPENRGIITAKDAVDAVEASARDEKIKEWAKSTWEAFSENRPAVINLLAEADFKEIAK